MTLATITSKGQVTVPKKFRDNLGLHAGDKIDFHLNDDGSITFDRATAPYQPFEALLKLM